MIDVISPAPDPGMGPSQHLFREGPGGITGSGVKTGENGKAVPEREDSIICRFCASVVTRKKEIIEINGRHYHVCENPAGVIYRIGCFASARGCMNMGEPTSQFTWFPGFQWCYALCSHCLNHLGWHYSSGGAGFYGLILDHLTENY